MPQVKVSTIRMSQRETIMVGWLPSKSCWVASVGNLANVNQREMEFGLTPAEALGKLMSLIGDE